MNFLDFFLLSVAYSLPQARVFCYFRLPESNQRAPGAPEAAPPAPRRGCGWALVCFPRHMGTASRSPADPERLRDAHDARLRPEAVGAVRKISSFCCFRLPESNQRAPGAPEAPPAPGEGAAFFPSIPGDAALAKFSRARKS